MLGEIGKNLKEYNQSMHDDVNQGQDVGAAEEHSNPPRDDNFSIASKASNAAKENIIETDGKSLDAVLQAANNASRDSTPDNSRGRS